MSSTKSEALRVQRVHSLKSEMLELHRRFSENVINKRAFAQRLHPLTQHTRQRLQKYQLILLVEYSRDTTGHQKLS